MRDVAVFCRDSVGLPRCITHIRCDLIPRKGDSVTIDDDGTEHFVLSSVLELTKNRVTIFIDDPDR
jgi:hypothetical protein